MKINILGFDLYLYSITLMIAFILGIILFKKEVNSQYEDKKMFDDYLFYLIILAIIGARSYYVIFNLDYYLNNIGEIIMLNHGGLAIYGGVIAGALYTIYFSFKHKINTLKVMDILVISLILGQVIGRWGNFFNGEAYGGVTTYQALKSSFIPEFIINRMYINNNYYQPTFLYESMLNLIGLVILLLIRKYYRPKLRIGTLTCFYLIYYGTVRLFIEGMRSDSLMLGNIRISQALSFLMIVGSAVYYFIKVRKGSYYEQRI